MGVATVSVVTSGEKLPFYLADLTHLSQGTMILV